MAERSSREIGELPLGLQAKLYGAGDPAVGDQKRAAWTRGLPHGAQLRRKSRGPVSRGLFYRVNVVVIELPPLPSERTTSPPLSRHFAARLAAALAVPLHFSDDAIAWLEHTVAGQRRARERDRAGGGAHEPGDPEPADLRSEPSPDPTPRIRGRREWEWYSRDATERAEREAIVDALHAADGNRRPRRSGWREPADAVLTDRSLQDYVAVSTFRRLLPWCKNLHKWQHSAGSWGGVTHLISCHYVTYISA